MTREHAGHGTAAPHEHAFDPQAFLAALDEVFASGRGLSDAEDLITEALAKARAEHHSSGELLAINELLGLYRSQGKHDLTERWAVRALAVVATAGLDGTQAHATTLINCATAHRAAGRWSQAQQHYELALELSLASMAPDDKRLAALHNNLSLLYTDLGDHQQAKEHLLTALAILTASTPEPELDPDVAGTHGNLALTCLALGDLDAARGHADAAMRIYAAAGLEANPHYAGALASRAQVAAAQDQHGLATDLYALALRIIEAHYGQDSDAYVATKANLDEVATHAPRQRAMTGLELARSYWDTFGAPMLEQRYPEYVSRIAVGLVGHGSQCYGFDDDISRDHDFGPDFCLWLVAEDFEAIGAQLQRDYDALPPVHAGVARSLATRRATGAGRRVGVFEIGDFYESMTGYRKAPAADKPHEWLALDHATLAAATNGEVFRDPLGAFSGVRSSFLRMPDDVRLALIARRLGMLAQAGQYNVPRMLDRGDSHAAWLAVAEFLEAASSLLFLLNRPTTVGYMPYYKWRFAALRRLARRPGARLAQVVPLLESIVDLAALPMQRDGLMEAVEQVCAHVVTELHVQRLSDSSESFLEHHRDAVAARIKDPWLRGL